MHRQLRTRLLAAPSGAAALVLVAPAAGSVFAQEPATVIRGATVFTGDEILETATVTIAAGFPAPWAGVMIGLAPGMMQPVDASDITALVFDARGEGGRYRVLALAESLGPVPATIEFAAGPVGDGSSSLSAASTGSTRPGPWAS